MCYGFGKEFMNPTTTNRLPWQGPQIDESRANLWQAFEQGRPINFFTMTPYEPPRDPILEMLDEREIDMNVEPPPLRPIYSLAGTCICTPGNLTSFTGAAKNGKSAAIGAVVASALPHTEGADLLGFTSGNPDHTALLWFDSEQSPDDFWHCVYRAVKRAGLQKPPKWLHAYSLTGLGHKRAWEAVQAAMDAASDKHDGLHSILIDGFADMVADVNDAEESNSFVAELHDMAIRYDCPILGVIHYNPGSEKSRGHLGSQIERKAETNLALEKDSDETTVLYSTKNRRAGIPKNLGPRFAFSTEAGMHVTVESRQSAKDAEKRDDLLALARDVFGDHPAMRYSDVVLGIKKTRSVSDRWAEREAGKMVKLTVLTKSVAGLYQITKPASTK